MKISHSGKEKYSQCSKSYELHYIKKLRPVKESSALKFGGALDLALNELLESRDLDKAKSIFRDTWSQYRDTPNMMFFKSDFDESLLTSEDSETISNSSPELQEHLQYWISLNYKGPILLDVYFKYVLPHIKRVLSVQEVISIKNDTGDEITGITDLICEVIPDLKNPDNTLIAVMDNKTASSPYVKNSFMTKEQTALYTYATGIENAGFFVLNKKDFKYQVIVGKVPHELQDKVIEDFVKVLDNIKGNVFKKNLRKDCFSFGRKCDYYKYCWNEGDMEGLYDKSIEQDTLHSNNTNDTSNSVNNIL